MSLSKPLLRKQILQQRRSLLLPEFRERSDRICLQLQSDPRFQQAKTILAYFSFRQEPDLSPLFADESRIWGFPRTVGQALFWHCWQPQEDLVTGNYGILEPKPDSPILQPQEVDLILVPCVGCDRVGYRLGYGGGYYDRLFSDPVWAKIPSLGIVFDFAVLEQLPVDPWDTPLGGVCCETELLWMQP